MERGYWGKGLGRYSQKSSSRVTWLWSGYQAWYFLRSEITALKMMWYCRRLQLSILRWFSCCRFAFFSEIWGWFHPMRYRDLQFSKLPSVALMHILETRLSRKYSRTLLYITVSSKSLPLSAYICSLAENFSVLEIQRCFLQALLTDEQWCFAHESSVDLTAPSGPTWSWLKYGVWIPVMCCACFLGFSHWR